MEEYRVLRLLHQGGFACVNTAIHKPSNVLVAIKVLNKRGVIQHNNHGNSTEVNLREAKFSLDLQHENIITTKNIIKTPTQINIIQELASSDLFDYVMKKGRIKNEETLKKIFKQIVLGVEYFHTILQYAHCDLKLENIVVFPGDVVKLIDFGLSQPVKLENAIVSGKALNKFSVQPLNGGIYTTKYNTNTTVNDSDGYNSNSAKNISVEGSNGALFGSTKNKSIVKNSEVNNNNNNNSNSRNDINSDNNNNTNINNNDNNNIYINNSNCDSNSNNNTNYNYNYNSDNCHHRAFIVNDVVCPVSSDLYNSPETYKLAQTFSRVQPRSQSQKEVLSKIVNRDRRPCDIWSLGVILYTLISGKQPYNRPSPLDRLYSRLQKNGPGNIINKHIKGDKLECTFHLMKLFERMFDTDRENRITIVEIKEFLNVPWFKKINTSDPKPIHKLQRCMLSSPNATSSTSSTPHSSTDSLGSVLSMAREVTLLDLNRKKGMHYNDNDDDDDDNDDSDDLSTDNCYSNDDDYYSSSDDDDYINSASTRFFPCA
eukprot:Awhi_evm1s837